MLPTPLGGLEASGERRCVSAGQSWGVGKKPEGLVVCSDRIKVKGVECSSFGPGAERSSGAEGAAGP